MSSNTSVLNSVQSRLDEVFSKVYAPAGIKITHPVQLEAESSEYGACRFGLNNSTVVFRVAKTTPARIGQFVTIWKRPAPGGEIAPLDLTDEVHYVVVAVTDGVQRGQFIFNQKILLAEGIMSRDGVGGKRAIRVYPPWTQPTAKNATRAQYWQTRHFFGLAADGTAESLKLVRRLFCL